MMILKSFLQDRSINYPKSLQVKLLSHRFAWNRDKEHASCYSSKPIASEAIKVVKTKVESGEYEWEQTDCFCSAKEDMVISEIDRYGFFYPVVICKRCGLLRANPRMSEESYMNFYRHDYRDVYGEGDIDIEELYMRRIAIGRKKAEYIQREVKLSGSPVIFEIGCDFGTTLLPLSEAGYEVYGCDYGVEHLKYGKTKNPNLNLLTGGIEQLINIGKKADLVIVHHVVEHFLDLRKDLGLIRNLLKPEGVLYVSIPGTKARLSKSFWRQNNLLQLLQNAHTYQFDLETLKYTMECCGLELIKGNESVEAFFTPVEHYRDINNYPVEEFRKTMKYLRTAEKKFQIKSSVGKICSKLGIKNFVKSILHQ